MEKLQEMKQHQDGDPLPTSPIPPIQTGQGAAGHSLDQSCTYKKILKQPKQILWVTDITDIPHIIIYFPKLLSDQIMPNTYLRPIGHADAYTSKL